MSPRKRRRSQALPEAEGDGGTAIQHLPVVSDRLPANDLDKERVIWDSFREEHFEAVDQMPLSLHRHYALIQELDQQAHSYIMQLFPTVQRYTSRRREMVDRLFKTCSIAATGSSSSGVSPKVDVPLKEERSSSPRPLTTRGHTSSSLLESMSVSHSGSGTLQVAPSTTRNLPHSESQQATQQMLSHIAWLSDEIFRASEEKVNLVQAAFDSADRHVRILDQAIKEQEASIGLGARPSHLAPNNLPELVVPRWARPSRTPLSPVDKDDDDITFPVREASYTHAPCRSGKSGHLPGSGTQREGSSLTIVLPASSNGLIDSPEQLFCYCKRVSFGEMVACDNEKCKIEWFHLECLRLRKTPEGSWYCSDKCRASARRKRK